MAAAKSSIATELSSSALPGNGEKKKDPAPLYITIGPQCCGKTTVLKDIDGLQDVCLDDQLDVYVSIATQQWLTLITTKASPNSNSNSNNNNNDVHNKEEESSTIPQELQRQVQGKTLAQRIQNDNPELNLILKRWNGDLSTTEFADALSQHYSNNVHSRNNQRRNDGETSPDVAAVLISVVEGFLSKDDPQLPTNTDVFCLESLFKPHTKTNQSAIQVAHYLVKAASPEIPLAWGNTNSKAKDFQQVLDIACLTNRPVHFVLCHPTWKLEEDDKQQHNIPWVEFSTLLSRNLKRLQATGRYIPANSIFDCCQRIQDQLIPSDCKSSWDVEQALVYQSTQPVRRHEKPLPFRYRLTRDRLIQKEYPERRPPQHRRQDQRREYSTNEERQYSKGRPPRPQQQRPQYNGRPQQNRGPPQDVRRFDNRRGYRDEDRSRRAGRGGYNDDRYARDGRGRGKDDQSRPQDRGQSPRGKRGYQDQRDGNSYPSEDNGSNKRYRR
ncbi:unnamed protein product [Cylindrotheca closterium]|uniref:Uncharacterized protein n=1 Tax=Cylindrotheca closterium TaxID=2856 RepID=A0AAD2CTA3_9STRA|nr:unnamed protein product [Cylindrotheca closterium]